MTEDTPNRKDRPSAPEFEIDNSHSSLDPRVQITARIVLSVALLSLGLYLVANYLRALAWASVLAITLWPFYIWIKNHTPASLRKEFLPALFTLAMGFLFLLPFVVVTLETLKEVQQIGNYGQQFAKSGIPVPDFVAHLPFGAHAISAWWNDHLAREGWTRQLLDQLNTTSAREIGRTVGLSLIHRIMLFGISLLTLFFLFRDGEAIGRQCLWASNRLFGERGEQIVRLMAVSINGTVSGLVLVGLGEGVVMGVAYSLFGTPHPIVFSAATAIAAMIPFLSYLAVFIVALVLLAVKSFFAAAMVAIIGIVVVFIADHFVRPVLIGGATKLPFLWVLIGILGGLESFQLLGLFIGPAIMAALLLLWKEVASPPDPPCLDKSSAD